LGPSQPLVFWNQFYEHSPFFTALISSLTHREKEVYEERSLQDNLKVKTEEKGLFSL
jgi:hypothetical protein